MRKKLLERSTRASRFTAQVFFWLAASASAFAQSPGYDAAALNDARDIYQANCAMCHGYDGVPILPGAPNFAVGDRLEKEDTELLQVMRDGKGTMPSWKDVMDDGEQQAALNYVRVVGGDAMFEAHCNECHDGVMPGLSKTVLNDDGKPKAGISPEEICADVAIEDSMETEDIAKVVNFLGDIPTLFLLAP